MRRRFKIPLFIFLFLFYIFLINYIFDSYLIGVATGQQTQQQNFYEQEGFAIDIGTSISFNSVVERPRFYGTIYELGYKDYRYSYLMLFNLIKMPISLNDFNYFWIHFFIILLLIFLFIIIR